MDNFTISELYYHYGDKRRYENAAGAGDDRAVAAFARQQGRQLGLQSREAMDPLQEFFTDYCVLGPDQEVRSRPLWDAYQQFARESHGRRPLSRVQLGERLRRRGCEPFTTGTTRGWRGIGLLVELAS
jgi:hypothetical protein